MTRGIVGIIFLPAFLAVVANSCSMDLMCLLCPCNLIMRKEEDPPCLNGTEALGKPVLFGSHEKIMIFLEDFREDLCQRVRAQGTNDLQGKI